MKLTAIILTIACMHVFAEGYSQKVTLSEQHASLSKVFSTIQKQSGYTFFYKNKLIRDTKVSVTLANATVEQALSKVLEGKDLTYFIIDNTIVINESNNVAESDNPPADLPPPPIVVKGSVRDSKGEPLIGASVKVKGTNTGVVTDAAGSFTITTDSRSTLVVSYTGFSPLEVAVNGQTTLTIKLDENQQALSEVVVTALGIAKERKALGYSVTEVKGETLTQAREINVANSLVGKVAGLNVSSVSGGPGSAVNIQIRGMSSISQSNQPLYVVNGIPMSNETTSGTGQYQDVADRGDNIGNLNPDDIESISILKGAAASALYGSRAKAGVILITTKSGKAGAPASVEFNSNYVVEQVRDPTDYQYEYGQGNTTLVNGAIVQTKPLTAIEAQNTSGSSWGPRIDGQPYMQMDGVMRPYSAARNNIEEFYRLGQTLTNTLAFSKGFDGGAVRFSASDLTNKNIVEFSNLDRQTFNFSGNMTLIKRLTLDVRANYILEKANNRVKLGDSPGNVNASIMRLATTIDIDDFKQATNPDGSELTLGGGAFTTNPWFAAQYFKQNTNRERLISSATLKYTFDNGLFLQLRGARDSYNDRFTRLVPSGTAYRPTGELQEQTIRNWETNADFLAGKVFKINDDMSLTPNIGASYRNIQSENFNAQGTGFAVPYVYYITNVPTRTLSYGLSNQEVDAVYGTLEFDYKNIVYLTGTGRSDWYSTLATPDNTNKVSQFYPSVSGSFVFSELMKNTKWLNFGKLRAGYAQVGQATSPYQTQLTYGFSSVTLNGLSIGNISGSSVPNKDLKPSLASELEIGTEMRLFNNIVSLDITYYDKKSRNEIVNAPTSTTSGYSSAALNIGKIRNSGVEALISVTPFKSDKFTWTTSVNGTSNKNEIISLAPGDAPYTFATARSGTAYIQHRVGEPAAQIVAYDFLRDANGNLVLNPSTGLVQPSNVLTSQGSAYAKWLAGWMNDFTFKRFNMGFLIDAKFGGKIYSATETNSYSNGKNKATLVGRDQIYGINQTASQYYSNLTRISALFVEDASFIKFRQFTLGYLFPTNMWNNRIKSINVSLVGRNLFTIMKKTDNIDPESAYSGSTTGIEAGSLPPQRSYGLNLSAKF